MIKTCLVLRKNSIAEAGDKNLYLRIFGPDGKVLPSTSGGGSATFDGSPGKYSISRQVDYRNEELDMCVFYKVANPGDLAKGNYTVMIYEEGKKIGQTTLALR